MSERWPMVPLADVCYFLDRRGVTPKKLGSHFIDAGFRVISAKNIKGRSVDLKVGDQRYVDNETYRKWMTSPLFADDVLLTSEAPLGEPAYLADDVEWCLGQRLFCLRSDKARLLGRYLFYALQSPIVRCDMLSRATGATAQGIRQAELRRVTVPIPPKHEQSRLVSILDEAFEAIDRVKEIAQQNLANARELFESYLNRVFNEKGEGWEERALGSFCQFASGGTPSKKNDSYWTGEIPWVSGRDMKSTEIWDTTLHVTKAAVDASATRLAPVGSLLVLVRGMGLAHGAQIAELKIPCTFNQDIRSLKPNPGIESRYLLFALRTRVDDSEHVLSNAAHGTLKIDMDALRNISIPVPTPDVQKEIATKIDSLASLTSKFKQANRERLVCLDELKQSILHKAFTGQLTAKSPELEMIG